LEARFAQPAAPAGALPAAAPGATVPGEDPAQALRERAKVLAAKDPARAASILKGWMTEGKTHA
ncbi:MAG TPA: hypothetical protein VLV17_05255, partial [Anaeromyxobacteraceae bacterium]|nr:hypothetical protein [Anaeromyxobacteraceae bacterium]